MPASFTCGGCCDGSARSDCTSRRSTCARTPGRTGGSWVRRSEIRTGRKRSREERIARLRAAIERDEAPTAVLDAAGKRALWVFEAIEYCRHRYGAAAIGSYVVSMAGGVDDLLEVLLIARWSGMLDEATGQVPLDVAPLFESAEALEQAGRHRRSAAVRPGLPGASGRTRPPADRDDRLCGQQQVDRGRRVALAAA